MRCIFGGICAVLVVFNILASEQWRAIHVIEMFVCFQFCGWPAPCNMYVVLKTCFEVGCFALCHDCTRARVNTWTNDRHHKRPVSCWVLCAKSSVHPGLITLQLAPASQVWTTRRRRRPKNTIWAVVLFVVHRLYCIHTNNSFKIFCTTRLCHSLHTPCFCRHTLELRI